MNSPTASISGGNLTNNVGGTISGTGQINNDLTNFGTIRASGSEHLVFNGANNLNAMNVNLSGGTLEFTQSMTNRSGAAITGRGTLITSSAVPGGVGLVNEGLMSFSAGIIDVHGDLDQTSDGRIVTSGNGVTTFFDDVVHNGTEIRTFLGSTTVFLGEQTGAGNFTGAGVVEYAGDLRPGNSPATISYEGDVYLNSSVRTFFELGGLNSGQFDQLRINGDFNVAGSLFVNLIDGHTLGVNQSYLIGEVGETLSGQFNGLGEGSLVGNFGGINLFISYAGGNGNDISLFTAVPEPSSLIMLGFTALGFFFQRRKPGHTLLASAKCTTKSSDNGLELTNPKRFSSAGLLVAAFTGLLVCGSTATASLITISNPSFENLVLADGTASSVIDNWSRLGSATVLNPTATQFPGGATDGNNVLNLGANGSIVHQDLVGTNLALGMYSFQFDVGNRMDEAFPDLRFNFLINATTIVPLHSSVEPSVPEGEFRTWTFNYNITPTLNSFIGDPTRIRFLVSDGATGGSAVIDNVRGTFTAVPEPGSLSLGLLAALATVSSRRRFETLN
jgi:hypothetical protein